MDVDDERQEESPDLVGDSGGDKNDKHDDEDYKPPIHLLQTISEPQQTQPSSDNNNEQEDQHLLVKLAIALMKPHFNCKLT